MEDGGMNKHFLKQQKSNTSMRELGKIPNKLDSKSLQRDRKTSIGPKITLQLSFLFYKENVQRNPTPPYLFYYRYVNSIREIGANNSH